MTIKQANKDYFDNDLGRVAKGQEISRNISSWSCAVTNCVTLTSLCACVQLKEMFPGFRLSLPPKRWFKDNYDSDFLEDRQLGLQAFLQNLVAHKDIANWSVT